MTEEQSISTKADKGKNINFHSRKKILHCLQVVEYYSNISFTIECTAEGSLKVRLWKEGVL